MFSNTLLTNAIRVIDEIAKAIQMNKVLKLPRNSVWVTRDRQVVVYATTSEETKKSSKAAKTHKEPMDIHRTLGFLEKEIPKVLISGCPTTNRTVVMKDSNDQPKVIAEGRGLVRLFSAVCFLKRGKRTNSMHHRRSA